MRVHLRIGREDREHIQVITGFMKCASDNEALRRSAMAFEDDLDLQKKHGWRLSASFESMQPIGLTAGDIRNVPPGGDGDIYFRMPDELGRELRVFVEALGDVDERQFYITALRYTRKLCGHFQKARDAYYFADDQPVLALRNFCVTVLDGGIAPQQHGLDIIPFV